MTMAIEQISTPRRAESPGARTAWVAADAWALGFGFLTPLLRAPRPATIPPGISASSAATSASRWSRSAVPSRLGATRAAGRDLARRGARDRRRSGSRRRR